MFVSKFGIVAVFAAGLGLAGSAEAAPISVAFNVNDNDSSIFNVASGPGAGTPGDVNGATSISNSLGGTAYHVAGIDGSVTNNTGLTSGTGLTLSNPLPTAFGATFTKTFITSLGTFTESLTVTSVTMGASAVNVLAAGTITSTNLSLTSSSVFWSSSYTQNGGPGAQINFSANDSTIPPPPPPPPPPSPTPEPASLALLGAGLAGLGAVRRRRKS